MTATNAKRVMLTNVRLAFPVLNTPEKFQGTGEPRYSATLLFEKGSPLEQAIADAMRAAAAEKWGENKADNAVKGLRAGLKTALADGDTKSQYDGFEGMMYVSAHSKENAPPILLDGHRKQLPRNTGLIYAGCYVNCSIEIWAQDNQYGKRLNAQLRGVQFVRDGDSFAGGRPADSDEFEEVEGATATDGDFGTTAEGEFA